MKMFRKNKIYQKYSRAMAVFLLLAMGFVYCTGITAFAAVDLDVTIIPPADTVQNGHYCDVGLQMVTKSANGYVEMVINIEYDADLLALASPVNDEGYKVTGSRGQLTLTYFDPTGTNTPTPIGNDKTITIRFVVQENAPDTTTKIKAKIDHAYNNRGKNVTWTPIYDKEIEIIRINESVSSEAVSSEEESSQFVVGKNAGTVSRSSSGAGTGGKVASVIIGAMVVFAAGMAAGYIMCMRRYEAAGMPPASPAVSGTPRPKRRQSYRGDSDIPYDDYDGNDSRGEYKSRSARQSRPKDDYEDYDNDDGFYTKAKEEIPFGNDDDYLKSAPVGSGASGNYLDAFTVSEPTEPTGSRSLSPDDFGQIIDGSGGFSDGGDDDGDDDYPILFMTREANGTFRHTSGPQTKPSFGKPTFDEEEDTIFGKFTENVNRNTDDGYGGLSSSGRRRDRDRSERSRRNR